MKNFLRFMSYVLVAAAASLVTLFWADYTQVKELSKLDQLSLYIQERFVGEVDVTAMEDAAAYAMVDALPDRWSYYIPASQYAAYQDQMHNSYVGVGITISTQDSGIGIEIMEVTKGGPAEEAGILAGDRIVAVNGQEVAQVGLTEASNLIRGEEGSTVELTVLRGEAQLQFTVERRTIRTVVATGQMLPGNVGLVTIENFDDRCAEESIAAIDGLVAQGAKALIFDVRNNPGGYVHELVRLLDHLLPEGLLFRSVEYTGREYTEESDARCIDLPMAVLVNGDSYSAAEFFAAAIREYEAGFVVGTKTCGKSYYQTAITLNDGSAVGLSVGQYFTPEGVSLAEVGGLTPEFVVEVDESLYAQIKAGNVAPENDPQIQKALEELAK